MFRSISKRIISPLFNGESLEVNLSTNFRHGGLETPFANAKKEKLKSIYGKAGLYFVEADRSTCHVKDYSILYKTLEGFKGWYSKDCMDYVEAVGVFIKTKGRYVVMDLAERPSGAWNCVV